MQESRVSVPVGETFSSAASPELCRASAPARRTAFPAPPRGMVRGIQPLSLCDWTGKMVLVLFLGGCDLRCPTCHNAALAWHSENLPPVRREEVAALLRARRLWYDGIVVSGGEPAVHAELPALLRDLREFGLPLRLDTNGMHPEVTEALLAEGLVDAVAMDVKGPYALYPVLTGGRVDAPTAAARLGAHFALAKDRPGVFRFRLTQVPVLTPADIETARSYLPQGHELTLQPYVPPRDGFKE